MPRREIRQCKVCVIGGAGFLGSTLVDYLIQERDCHVLVLDNLISGQKKHVHDKADFEWFDIRDSEIDLASLLEQYRITHVFNYAAEPYIPQCFERPAHFFSINAVAVLNVLNACKIAGIEAVLQVSSAEIYGDMKGKISEEAKIEPHSTYGVSKMAADGLVQVRWREADVPAIALRQFNCVGPRETHEYVIPEIIAQIYRTAEDMRKFDDSDYSNGENPAGEILRSNFPIIQLGNNTTRDFLYSGDAVRMAVNLLECGKFGEVYNMGSENAVTIHDLAKLIGRVMGWDELGIETEARRIRPWEIWHLQSDNTKLYNAITTRPQYTLTEALQFTVDYFNHNNHQWDW